MLILLVVLGHVVGAAEHIAVPAVAAGFYFAYKAIYIFHMPAFFFLSGLLFKSSPSAPATASFTPTTFTPTAPATASLPPNTSTPTATTVSPTTASFPPNTSTRAIPSPSIPPRPTLSLFAKSERGAFFAFILKRFRRLMIPYFVFGVLSIALYYIIGTWFAPSNSYYSSKVAVPLWQALAELVYGGAVLPRTVPFAANSVLWFLPVLFATEWVHCLYSRFLSAPVPPSHFSRKVRGFCAAHSDILLCVLCFVLASPVVPSCPWPLPFGLHRVPYFLFFFALGRLSSRWFFALSAANATTLSCANLVALSAAHSPVRSERDPAHSDSPSSVRSERDPAHSDSPSSVRDGLEAAISERRRRVCLMSWTAALLLFSVYLWLVSIVPNHGCMGASAALFGLFAALAVLGIVCSALFAIVLPVRLLSVCGCATMAIMLLHKFIVVALQFACPPVRGLFTSTASVAWLATVLVVFVAVSLCLIADRLLRRFVPWTVGSRHLTFREK